MYISWHDPELYYFLPLLAGIAALLASLYEFSRPGRLKGPSRKTLWISRRSNPCRVPSRSIEFSRMSVRQRRSVIVRCQPKKSTYGRIDESPPRPASRQRDEYRSGSCQLTFMRISRRQRGHHS